MDSTFVLSSEELDLKFLETIKSLYKDSQMLQITISKSEDISFGKKETKKEYFQRLEKAASEVDEGNKISLTPIEFDELVNESLK